MRSTPTLLISGLLAACTAVSSHAAFVLTLDDPNTLGLDVILADDTLIGLPTDSGLIVNRHDQIGGSGVISFSGAVGSFIVNVTTGISKPLIGPSRLDLNSIDVSGAAGRLIISLTDTDYTLPAGGFTAEHGGTTDGMVDISYRYDASNQEFGGSVFASAMHTATQIRSFDFVDTGYFPPAGLYSLTIMAEVEHTGPYQVTSFDAVMSPVPVPAAAWLFGSALAGLYGWKRRK